MCYIYKTNKRQDQLNSKYNKVYPIELSSIPDSEKELALTEFSEGLEELKLCLKVLWDNGLETKACCAGNHNDGGHAYIAMEEEVDLFEYLSPLILEDDNIRIEYFNGMQIIRFYGDSEQTKQEMLSLAECILTGPKDNKKDVRKKMITSSINKRAYVKKSLNIV